MQAGGRRRLTSIAVACVLIADDDIVVRDVVRRYLERDGLDVAVADDGDEALRLLDTKRIDLAVLDVMMPGQDGLALCRTLRRGDGYAIPVILLTALGEEDDRIAGLEAGADDYVTKPFSPRELALRVRSLLRRAPAPALSLEWPTISGGHRREKVSVDRSSAALTGQLDRSAQRVDPKRRKPALL